MSATSDDEGNETNRIKDDKLKHTRSRSTRAKPLDYKKLNDGSGLFEEDVIPPKRLKIKTKTNDKPAKVEISPVKCLVVNKNDNATKSGIKSVRTKAKPSKTAKLDPFANDQHNPVETDNMIEFINNFNDGVQVAVAAGDLEDFDRRDATEMAVGNQDNSDDTFELEAPDEELDYDEGETVVEPVDIRGPVQNVPRQGEPIQETQTILTKATRDWLAEQRRQDDIRFKSMMRQLLEEKNGSTSGQNQGMFGVTNEQRRDNNLINLASHSKRKTPVKQNVAGNMVKSPSDTTIYVPALQRSSAITAQQIPIFSANQTDISEEQNNIIQNISDFVGNARRQIESRERRTSGQLEVEPQPCTSRQATVRSTVEVTGRNEAQQLTEQAVIDTEKFKANVALPKGESAIPLINLAVETMSVIVHR